MVIGLVLGIVLGMTSVGSGALVGLVLILLYRLGRAASSAPTSSTPP